MLAVYSNMTETVFRRKAYEALKQWKARSKGSTAMLVEGARRVGKSTLVREFAEREYASCIIIDFSESPEDVRRTFDFIDDLDTFFRDLQVLYKTDLIPRESAIVFDEVQLFPWARQSVKHLVKDGRYDYIEAGSFVSIRKNVKDIVLPSEEECMKLHPLDFEEFLWAKGNSTFGLLKGCYERREKVGDAAHAQMMKLYREYIAVGGMPQAVSRLVEGGSYREIDGEKRKILEAYLDDLRKLDPKGKLEQMFMSIPSQLSGGSYRFRASSAIRNGRRDRDGDLIYDLEDSQAIRLCRHVDDPKAGLELGADLDCYKAYLEDTGLLVTLCFYDKEFSENGIYDKLVSGRLSADLDYVYENAVAQALTAMGLKLYYHTFLKDDGKHRYEVDFITAVGDRVRPIEVKSSRVSDHRSLDVFITKEGLKLETPVVVSPSNLELRDGILYLPVYMMQFLDPRRRYAVETDTAWTGGFDEGDWVPVEGGFILYAKAKDHGKKGPKVSVTRRNRKGGVETMDVAVDIDDRGKVKNSSQECRSCTVRITGAS